MPLPPPNALVRAPNGPPPTGDGARQVALHFTLLPRWALDGTPSPQARSELEVHWGSMGLLGTNHGQYELSLSYIKKTLALGTLDAGDTIDQLLARIEHLTSTDYWDWELVVVTERVAAPREVGPSSFEAGELTGHALLWSYVDSAVRCAGLVEARNQDEVMSIKVAPRFATVRNGFLDQDLEAQAFAVAVVGLAMVSAH